jgi:hypothetical protein
VPVIVIVLLAQVADTPDGNPFAPEMPSLDIPVAPVVVIVMLVSAVLIHNVGVEEGEPAVLLAVTVIVPVAFTLPQPPVIGML